ncbi:uncharacterized protein LOC141858504 [Brevipalpus obovatus]|uniref:uncharacterized protein LOC141858504 n=1 Tax=Brevipalpus obovatus TaxID=246614 RepID=UPI003D9DEBE6
MTSNTRNRRTFFSVSKLSMLLIVILIIIAYHGQQSHAIKKKKMLKKLKDALPLLLALKPKKKILLLPVPIPMKGKFGNLGNALAAMNPLAGLRAQSGWGGGYGGGGGGGLPSFGALASSNYGSATGAGFDYGNAAPIKGPKMMMMFPAPIQRPTSGETSWSNGNIDNMNNALMNQAMDEWMMMAAMDCFGMDNMIHDHRGGNRPHDLPISEKHVQSRPYYRSPAQIARENHHKVNQNQHQQEVYHEQRHHYPQQQQQQQEIQHHYPPVQQQKIQEPHFQTQIQTFRPEIIQQQQNNYQHQNHYNQQQQQQSYIEKENFFDHRDAIKGSPQHHQPQPLPIPQQTAQSPQPLTSPPSYITTQATSAPIYFGEEPGYGQRLMNGQNIKGTSSAGGGNNIAGGY